MRIALLTHQFPGARLGGIGAYTLHAARALVQAGHEPHVFTFTLPEDVRRSLPGSVIVHEVEDLAARAQKNALAANLASAMQAGGEAGYRLAMGSLLCEEFRRVHAERPFDVVEGPEYEALALPLMIGEGRALDVPVITHLHSGSAVARRAMNLPETTAQRLIEAFEFACIGRADGLCAPSRQVVVDTEQAAPVGVAEVIPLPYVTESAARFSSPDPAAPILFLGRLEFIKGAHLLPEALNRFLADHPAATVRLAGPDTPTAPDGSGSMQNFIRNKLAAELLSRVLFLGEQPRERVTAELAACSFVLVPSLFESYSYVCCEALAAGRPVVVSAGIGATEVVGDAGISFARADATALAGAMARLAGDGALLRELAERAYRRSHAELSADSAIDKRIRFYERIIRTHHSGARRTSAGALSMLPATDSESLLEAIARLKSTLAGVSDVGVNTPGMLLAGIMDEVAPGGGARIVLYGAGRHTSRLLAEISRWETRGHRVVGIIDDHPRFRDQPSHRGLPVDSLESFAQKPLDPRIAVVLSTDTFTEQFWQNTAPLRTKGIRVFRLYA